MTHKEAIDVVRNIYQTDKEKEALETLIPELADSEDERIRNEIIAFIEQAIHSGGGTIIPQEKEDRWIAYLEKRKEQKPSAVEVLNSAGLKTFRDGNQWCTLAGDNIQEGICGFGDTIDEALYEFLKEVLSMASSPQLKEQKPAEWSEKDEKPFNDVLNGLKYAYEDLTNHKSFDSARDIKEAFDWMQARLKSLRPQPHWKPSEEQMKSLKNCVNGWQDTADGTLESLYNDLKKL